MKSGLFYFPKTQLKIDQNIQFCVSLVILPDFINKHLLLLNFSAIKFSSSVKRGSNRFQISQQCVGVDTNKRKKNASK